VDRDFTARCSDLGLNRFWSADITLCQTWARSIGATTAACIHPLPTCPGPNSRQNTALQPGIPTEAVTLIKTAEKPRRFNKQKVKELGQSRTTRINYLLGRFQLLTQRILPQARHNCTLASNTKPCVNILYFLESTLRFTGMTPCGGSG